MVLTIIEVAVLGVAAMLAVRVLAKRPIRREVKAHPLVAVVALAIAIGVAAVSVNTARQSAVGRPVMIGMVGLAVIFAVVRARPRFGRAAPVGLAVVFQIPGS